MPLSVGVGRACVWGVCSGGQGVGLGVLARGVGVLVWGMRCPVRGCSPRPWRGCVVGRGYMDIEKRPPCFWVGVGRGCAVGVLAGGYSVGLSVWALCVR